MNKKNILFETYLNWKIGYFSNVLISKRLHFGNNIFSDEILFNKIFFQINTFPKNLFAKKTNSKLMSSKNIFSNRISPPHSRNYQINYQITQIKLLHPP